MNQALDADEAGLKDIAIKLYTDAAELGLSTVNTIPPINNILILYSNYIFYLIYMIYCRKLLI